jgi:hypothetical protein
MSNTSAFNTLWDLFQDAMDRAGHLFFPQRDGVTRALEPMMHQAGILTLQTRVHQMEYHGGTREGQLFAEDMRLVFRTLVPFLRKWIKVPDNYESLYRQMLQEMQQPDFVATMRLLTCWGTNPFAADKLVYDQH